MAGYDATTALIVVDLQNDFADPAGSLYVRGGEALIPFINREIARASAVTSKTVGKGFIPASRTFASLARRSAMIWFSSCG